MKPFWKTSEFWLTVVTLIGTNTAAITSVLPPRFAAIATAVIAAAYSIARGLTKIHPPRPPATVISGTASTGPAYYVPRPVPTPTPPPAAASVVAPAPPLDTPK